MMRSLYAGVTGLRCQQIKMDVLGNNIANVGTAGFKKSRVVFSDKLYQAFRGASRPSEARGGTNPMAVGLGASVFSIDQIHTPYTAQITNRLTDMAIDGDGYFILKQSNGAQVYTRNGAFGFDEWNNLVNTEGSFVQGWLADIENGYAITPSPTTITNININDYLIMAPRTTTKIVMEGNLNSTYDIVPNAVVTATNGLAAAPPDDQNFVVKQSVYDSLGNETMLNMRFFKTAVSATESTWSVDISLDSSFSTTPDPANPGSLLGTVTGSAISATPIIFTNTGDHNTYRINGLQFDTLGQFVPFGAGSDETRINLRIPGTTSAAEPINFYIDLKDIVQYNANTNVDVNIADGNTMGQLVMRSIGTDGIMTGTYDNDEKRPLFMVATASFKNPEGLEQIGSSSWRESANSGEPRIGEPGTASRGKILPGNLEMSNVDLAEEFVEMIVTQRGFSANSRVITTSDEMLQELVNLKR